MITVGVGLDGSAPSAPVFSAKPLPDPIYCLRKKEGEENNNVDVNKAKYPSLGGLDSSSALLTATILRRNNTNNSEEGGNMERGSWGARRGGPPPGGVLS